MVDPAVGRLLVASLHQAIADHLPDRLEFYESYLSPRAMRTGRIGVGSVSAALSFLRLEGEAYAQVVDRAGVYAADWMAADVNPWRRAILRAAPAGLRRRLLLRLLRGMIGRTSNGTRASTRWRRGTGTIGVRGSLFCDVRAQAGHPLCGFYGAAARRLLEVFDVLTDVDIEACQAMGADGCQLTMRMRAGGA